MCTDIKYNEVKEEKIKQEKKQQELTAIEEAIKYAEEAKNKSKILYVLELQSLCGGGKFIIEAVVIPVHVNFQFLL